MDIKFDYEDGGMGNFGSIHRPVAKVTFRSPKLPEKTVSTWMVVDTGADYSILPHHLSEKLRISLKNDCIKDTTYGVGGQQTVYYLKNKIEAKIGNIYKMVPLAFLDNDEIPPLLGRQGFLEIFNVEFLKSHIVVFKN